jgi:hypothetical protein
MALLAPGCDETKTTEGESDETETSEKTVAIASSLEGKEVLPRHLRWVVTTSLPADQVQEVRFLIDGDMSWIDRMPPYMYGGDGGYLVTVWLTGPNEFTAQVVDRNGSISSESVTARVPRLEPVEPYGHYIRVTAAELGEPIQAEQLGLGKASLDIYGVGEMWIGSPKRAYAFEYAISANGKTLKVLAPIHKAPLGVDHTESGFHFDGDLCSPDGPFASYSLAQLGAARGYYPSLRLTARNDPCRKRRSLMEGIWANWD